MSIEKEGRAEGFANENSGRDGGYRSYNRYNNGGEQRSYRSRSSYGHEGNERSYRSSGNRYGNGERPQRPRFNPNAEGGEQRAYRPRTSYNREGGYQGGERRPRVEQGYGEQRSYRSAGSRFGNGERPQRPRFTPNTEGGEQRPYRSGGNYNREGGFQGGEQRSRFQSGAGRSFRPRTAGYNPNAKYSHKKQIEYKDLLTDPNEPIRLNKFLANAGICSRREADEFIAAGVVSVNGEVVTELGTKIKRTDEVKFHDEPVNIERKVYVLLI